MKQSLSVNEILSNMFLLILVFTYLAMAGGRKNPQKSMRQAARTQIENGPSPSFRRSCVPFWRNLVDGGVRIDQRKSRGPTGSVTFLMTESEGRALSRVPPTRFRAFGR